MSEEIEEIQNINSGIEIIEVKPKSKMGRPKLSEEELQSRKEKRDAEKKAKAKKVGRPKIYATHEEYIQNQIKVKNEKIKHKRAYVNLDDAVEIVMSINDEEKKEKFIKYFKDKLNILNG